MDGDELLEGVTGFGITRGDWRLYASRHADGTVTVRVQGIPRLEPDDARKLAEFLRGRK